MIETGFSVRHFSNYPESGGLMGTQKAQAVANILRDRILLGDLQPGMRIRELETARELQISQGPVREALRLLAGEGLVETKPNRGTMVTDIVESEVSEAYELRALIEGRSARLVAANWSSEFERVLLSTLDEIRDAAIVGDYVHAVAADLNFHRTMCALAGPKIVLRVWEDVALHIRRYKTLTDKQLFGGDLSANVGTHYPVMDALRSGDPDLAERTLHRHVFAARKAMNSRF